MKKDLPKGWELKKLGEICGIVYGKGLPVKELKASGFPVFGANGLIGFNDKYLFEDPQVLISCRGAASGKINLSPPKCFVTNNSLILDIKQKKDLDRTYLYYALSVAKKTKLVTGTAQPQVTINNAIELEIPLPPLSEQKTIVSKIEELLSELDNGKEQLQTALQQLKVYRQSLLKWAFEGKLTNKKIIKGALPKGWKKVEINNLSKLINGDRGKNYPNRNEYVSKGIPFINTGHIEPNGKLDLGSMNYITPEKFNTLNSGKVKVGDLIYCLRGATMGKTAIIEQFDKGAIASSLVIIRVNSDVHFKYIYYFLICPFGKDFIKKFDNGTAQPNLSAKSLSMFLVPLPSFNEQQLIVDEIESKLTVCDKIEEIISQSLQRAETLRQSVLKKAFEGRLL